MMLWYERQTCKSMEEKKSLETDSQVYGQMRFDAVPKQFKGEIVDFSCWYFDK